MASYFLSPISAIFQYFNDIGIVLNGGTVNTYLAGTSTPVATYTDSTGFVANATSIVLASNGRLPNVQMWQAQGVNIKVIVKDAGGNQIGPVFDQISGINDTAGAIAALQNPANGQGADLVANAVRSFDIFSSVRLWTPGTFGAGQTLVAIIQGGTSVNDGLGGVFEYATGSSAADDGINVIKPNVSGTGRFIRLYPGVSGQTFTGTVTGMTATVTGGVYYTVASRTLVTLQLVSGAIMTGTSNATTMTLTGLPTEVTPPTLGISVPCVVEDNTTSPLMGWATINTAGTITFGLGANPNFSGFTTSGTKGLPGTWTITYPLK